jgi:transcriptional activator of cad operon
MNQAPKDAPNCLKIGEWAFYVRSHELSRNGKTIRLEPRVASLLLYLATHPGEPVSRTALLEALWPGVVVSDEVLTNAVNKLRRAFGDERTDPKVIETIPKAGYRLLLPVHAQEPVESTSPLEPASQPMNRVGGKSRPRWQISLAVVVVVGLAVSIIMSLRLTGPSVPGHGSSKEASETMAPRPTLAVLPFQNLSSKPEEDYFADGITDDVITRLAKNAGLMVIARDSTFFYKGKSLDTRTIAAKLNAGYVLRGSVQRDGEALKLHVSLVDGATGVQIWTQRYERNVGQVFETLSERAAARQVSFLPVREPCRKPQGAHLFRAGDTAGSQVRHRARHAGLDLCVRGDEWLERRSTGRA